MRPNGLLALMGIGTVLAGVTALFASQTVQKQQHSPQPAARAARPAPATQPATTQPASAPLYVGERPDEWKSYQEMHAYFLNRFVNSRGFGLERMVRVNEPRYRTLYAEATHYRIGAVQLLSLNDGHRPFEYETPLDTDKLRIKHAKHIPATDAEVAALDQLKSGHDVVLTGDGNRRYLIGAVRATFSCTECHSVKEGTLLGAFRYPLIAVAVVDNGAAKPPPTSHR